MKKMSLFQVFLLVVFGIGALGALAIFALAVGGGQGSTVGHVVIWGTFDKNQVNAALAEISNTDHDFGDVTYVQKDPATYIGDITQALAQGQGPDLMILPDEDAYAAGPLVTILPNSEITPATFASTFIDGALPFLSPRGVIGLPFVADPLVLYWNHDLLNSAGYANAPQYWDELFAMATAITRRTADGAIQIATVPFGVYSNYDNAKVMLSTLIEQAGGKITDRASDGHLASALAPQSTTTATVAESALRYFTEFADPSKTDYSWSPSEENARSAFAGGTLALYIGYLSEDPIIRAKNPNLNYTQAVTPQIRSKSSFVDGGRVYALAIARTSKNPAGADQIARRLAGADDSPIIAKALGLVSARRDVLQGKTDLASQSAGIMRTWTDPDPTKTGDIFRAMIQDVTSGAAFVPEAVQRADQKMQLLLDQLSSQTS